MAKIGILIALMIILLVGVLTHTVTTSQNLKKDCTALCTQENSNFYKIGNACSIDNSGDKYVCYCKDNNGNSSSIMM